MTLLRRRAVRRPQFPLHHHALAIQIAPLFGNVIDRPVLLIEREIAHRLEVHLKVITVIDHTAGQDRLEIQIRQRPRDQQDKTKEKDQPEINPLTQWHLIRRRLYRHTSLATTTTTSPPASRSSRPSGKRSRCSR